MKLERINKIDHVGVNSYFITKGRPIRKILGYDLMASNLGFMSKCYWFNSDRVGFVEGYNIRFKI